MWASLGRGLGALIPVVTLSSVSAASGAGDGARLHPRAGGRCHHWEEGPAHQAALPVRKCLYQGRVVPERPSWAGKTTGRAQAMRLETWSCGAGEGGQGPSCLCCSPLQPPSLFPLQIAPPETPDSKVRMVVITGPPEAQFKVPPALLSLGGFRVSLSATPWSWKGGGGCSPRF